MIDNNSKIEEIRMEDKKASKKFIVILIVALIAGMVTGFVGAITVGLAVNSGWDFIEFSKAASRIWIVAGRYLLIVVNVVALPILWFFFVKYRKEFRTWDGEDEAVYDNLDKKLGICLIISSVITVFNMLTYGIGFYGTFGMEETEKSAVLLIDLIFFIGSALCVTVYQSALINLIKEMNPEKQGSVYDSKFQKKWLNSCDEAEKQKIGEACYATYTFMSSVYQVLSLILMVVGFFLPIGVLPLTLVCLLWMAQLIFYSIKAR